MAVVEATETIPRARVRWWLLVLAALVVGVGVVWGWRIQANPDVHLGAAPLVGVWRLRWGTSIVPAAMLAGAVAWFGPGLAERLHFARLTAGTAVTSVAFAFLLAASDGLDDLLDPVVDPTEYWANLRILPGVAEMLRRYDTVEFLSFYSVHARGHPPGFLLILKGLAGIGLDRPWAAAAVSFGGIALVAAAVVYTVREVAGDRVARRTAPFLVVAPYSVWMGTSADAFYSGVGALGVALGAAALGARTVRTRRLLALGSGLALGGLLFLTYGAVLFLLLPIGVVLYLARRRPHLAVEVVSIGTAGAIAVFLVFLSVGYWWLDGLFATRDLYWLGSAQFRPAAYFAIGNVAAALIAVGPAVVAGLSVLRDRRVWVLVGLGGLCIAIADASQYSKAEVERIWLLFLPWLVPAVAALARPQRWLAIQGAVALGLQIALVSKW